MIRPWEGYIKPFRIFGNLYFVGSRPASSHLIDTGEGRILIDSGYPQTLYLVLEVIREVGFQPKDLQYILHSHGHYDHIGGTRALAELTGAKTIIGAADADMCTGRLDLTWARELGYEFVETFEPDILLSDQDVIRLGNPEIYCIASPGHTPGTMSFFFNVTNGQKIVRAEMHGGVGVKSLSGSFLERYQLSFDCRRQYLDSIERLKKEEVDLFLGNHV